MNAHHTLALPELLEVIFAFLRRKDLYRSCTRVNRQWNSVSMHIIREKRKAEFISIPCICDNILLHVYNSSRNNVEFDKYLDVSKLWGCKLSYLYVKDFHLNIIRVHDQFLNSARNITRSLLFYKKRQLIHYLNKVPHSLKYGPELVKYYQDILSQYDIRGEFLRQSKAFRSLNYKSSIQNEFRRMSRVFRSIN
ncbi:unnamed protein product [Rhizophagus irregularis]|nr:unnamed protein product [Rhizophagus irregularis]CAB5366762.1 unnamed protein product [Rhizophagus irregularis]